jgi:hypothetical protein
VTAANLWFADSFQWYFGFDFFPLAIKDICPQRYIARTGDKKEGQTPPMRHTSRKAGNTNAATVDAHNMCIVYLSMAERDHRVLQLWDGVSRSVLWAWGEAGCWCDQRAMLLMQTLGHFCGDVARLNKVDGDSLSAKRWDFDSFMPLITENAPCPYIWMPRGCPNPNSRCMQILKKKRRIRPRIPLLCASSCPHLWANLLGQAFGQT